MDGFYCPLSGSVSSILWDYNMEGDTGPKEMVSSAIGCQCSGEGDSVHYAKLNPNPDISLQQI